MEVTIQKIDNALQVTRKRKMSNPHATQCILLLDFFSEIVQQLFTYFVTKKLVTMREAQQNKLVGVHCILFTFCGLYFFI